MEKSPIEKMMVASHLRVIHTSDSAVRFCIAFFDLYIIPQAPDNTLESKRGFFAFWELKKKTHSAIGRVNDPLTVNRILKIMLRHLGQYETGLEWTI